MNNLKSKHFPDNFYRVSVKGAFVVDGKLMLIKEPVELSGQWELPGGGLDFGETPQIGLKREVEEELNLTVSSVSDNPIYAWVASFENRRNMDWYKALVLVYQIQLPNLEFTPSEEAEAIDFFSPLELQDLDLHHQTMPLREHFDSVDFN